MRLAVAVASLAFVPHLLAQTAPPAPEIVTSGFGSVTLPADRAIVRVGISTRAATASEASAVNGPLVIKVQDTLRTLGLVDRNARVVSFGVSPTYDYSGNTQRLTGYEARTTLEVSMREVAALGKMLDAVLSAGATEIHQITFASDTAAAAKRHALRAALATAKDEAQALATAAGGRLGALKTVSTSADNQTMFRLSQESGVAGGSGPLRGAVPTVQRDVVVSASVFGRWVFIPTP